MKKSLIALSLVSVFAAGGAYADTTLIKTSEIEAFAKEHNINVSKTGQLKQGNKVVGRIDSNDKAVSIKLNNATNHFNDAQILIDRETGKAVAIGDGEVADLGKVAIADDEAKVDPKKPSGGDKPIFIDPIDPKKPNNGGNVTPARTNVKASEIKKLAEAGYTAKVDSKGNAQIFDKGGKIAGVVNKDGKGGYMVVDANTGERSGIIIENDLDIDIPNVNPVVPEVDIVNPIVDEIEQIRDVANRTVEDIYSNGSAVAAKSVANESRINKLEDSFKDMAARQDKFEDKLNKMDKKMDGVMAGTHAVTNARPMVAGGQTAFGVGTGFAGSAQAVAVGVAHNFKDSAWSVSATTNVSTGSGVKTQVSGGVGAHYVF